MSAGCAGVVVLDLLVVAILWQEARPAVLLVLAVVLGAALLYHLSGSDDPLWMR